jgi:hypothetical protein
LLGEDEIIGLSDRHRVACAADKTIDAYRRAYQFPGFKICLLHARASQKFERADGYRIHRQ